MKKRDIERKIFEAYKAETPNLHSSILASCEREDQVSSAEFLENYTRKRTRNNLKSTVNRISAIAACLAIFVFGILIGRLVNGGASEVNAPTAEAFIFFDVNPSVELQVDGENKVIECIAGNEDAKTVLSGLKLEDVDMNTALTAIVGSMYVNGYLTEDSNSILISVETSDEEKTAKLLNDITAKINTVFEKSTME